MNRGPSLSAIKAKCPSSSSFQNLNGVISNQPPPSSSSYPSPLYSTCAHFLFVCNIVFTISSSITLQHFPNIFLPPSASLLIFSSLCLFQLIFTFHVILFHQNATFTTLNLTVMGISDRCCVGQNNENMGERELTPSFFYEVA